MAADIFKAKALGKQLTAKVIQRLCLRRAMKEEFKIRNADQEFKNLSTIFNGDIDFISDLKKVMAQNENLSNIATWWPTQVWRSRFLRRYNLSFSKNSKTRFYKRELLSALVPSLEQTFALRIFFESQVVRETL